MNPKLIITAAALALTLATTATAQQPVPKSQKPKAETAKEEKKPGELKKYEDVITKDAKTQTGLFKVHQAAEKYYWEIPTGMLNREMLWQTEIAQMPSQSGYPGMSAGTRIVRAPPADLKDGMRIKEKQ